MGWTDSDYAGLADHRKFPRGPKCFSVECERNVRRSNAEPEGIGDLGKISMVPAPYKYRLFFQNALVTLGCMAAVCVVFIRNPLSVGLATASILSISIGVTGYLCFWDLDLDPVTLCAVIVSIGMSVDFVAHVACHYQVRYKEFEEKGVLKRIEMKTPESRVVNSLSNVLWPMVQSASSTLLCVLPLGILQVPTNTYTLPITLPLKHSRTTSQWSSWKPSCSSWSGECSTVLCCSRAFLHSFPCLCSTRRSPTCCSAEHPLRLALRSPIRKPTPVMLRRWFRSLEPRRLKIWN